jgi:hypothetical protein
VHPAPTSLGLDACHSVTFGFFAGFSALRAFLTNLAWPRRLPLSHLRVQGRMGSVRCARLGTNLFDLDACHSVTFGFRGGWVQ